MLVLGRKVGESIVIGDNIVITFNRFQGNRIQVGIEAPKDVSIRRGELRPQAHRYPPGYFEPEAEAKS